MLVNILPEQAGKALSDNGSGPALNAAQLATLLDAALASGGIAFGGSSYGANLVTGGTATASDEYSATYAASKAADGNAGTWWESLGAEPHWWKYQFAAAKVVTKIGITLGHIYGLKDFTIAGSNDNANWTTLYTGQAAQTTARQDFTFANGAAWLYIKINGTSVWAATNSFRFVDVLMHESVQGSLKVKLDATGGGSQPVREVRYYTTETDPARVTVKTSADNVNWTAQTAAAGGAGYLKAAVGAAARYVTIDHSPPAQQTAYEIEVRTARCPRHLTGRYHVLRASSRWAAPAYNVIYLRAAATIAGAFYSVYQRTLKSSATRYHNLQPAARPVRAFYHLFQAAGKHLGARYHLLPPVPVLLNAVGGAKLESIIAGLLKSGAVTASVPCHLWNDRGGGSALKMGNIKITAALNDGRYGGGAYPQGAELVAGKWVELKSAGVLGTGITDDTQTLFTPVGGDPALNGLAVGAIPANAGRVIAMRINVPASPLTPFSATPRLDIAYDAFADPGFGGNFGSYFGG